MSNIKKFDEYISENFSLSKEEVDYLWSKIEYVKKKKAIESENDLFKLLNTGKTSFNDDETLKILNSLEYSFKKKLKDGSITTELGKSIHTKLPNDWLGVKYSVIKAKDKRDKKENSDKK